MIQGVFFLATTILGIAIYLYKKHKRAKLQAALKDFELTAEYRPPSVSPQGSEYIS